MNCVLIMQLLASFLYFSPSTSPVSHSNSLWRSHVIESRKNSVSFRPSTTGKLCTLMLQIAFEPVLMNEGKKSTTKNKNWSLGALSHVQPSNRIEVSHCQGLHYAPESPMVWNPVKLHNLATGYRNFQFVTEFEQSTRHFIKKVIHTINRGPEVTRELTPVFQQLLE